MAKRRYLNEYRVHIERVRPGERAVPLGYPENLGLRTKLGGKPDWIQGDETPDCDSCGEPMYFVAQIDSIEHDSEHNPLMQKPPKHVDFMLINCRFCHATVALDKSAIADIRDIPER